jgi:Ca-activated chloride channel family protein
MVARLLAVLTTVGLLVPATAMQQQPAFRAGVETVSIYATVRSSDGRLVPDLTRDDFVVLDNGQPQDLTVFSNDVAPITIAVMIDVSGSVTREVSGATRAVRALISPPDRTIALA